MSIENPAGESSQEVREPRVVDVCKTKYLAPDNEPIVVNGPHGPATMTPEDTIYYSEDYANFSVYEHNRDTHQDRKAYDKLLASMKAYGWVNCFPIGIIQAPDGSWQIVEGQHRFRIARQLKLKIKFVILNAREIAKVDLAKVGGAVSPWDDLQNLTLKAAKQGAEGPAEAILQLAQELAGPRPPGKTVKGAKPMHAAALMAGVDKLSTAQRKAAKEDGQFDMMTDAALFQKQKALIIGLMVRGRQWAVSCKAMAAFRRLCQVPGFEVDLFLERFDNKVELSKKDKDVLRRVSSCNDKESYIENMAWIFNNKAPKHLQLPELADDAKTKK